MGVSISSGDREFSIPDSCPIREDAKGVRIDENGKKYVRVMGVRWFTNLTNRKRNQTIPLYAKQSEKHFPKYDNYDAINIDKVVDIPFDYNGVMGVPVSLLDKFNPEQFEILGLGNSRFNFTPSKLYDANEIVEKFKGAVLNDVLNFATKIKPEKVAYHKLKNGDYV